MVRKKTIEVSFLANIFIIGNFVRVNLKLRRLKDKKSQTYYPLKTMFQFTTALEMKLLEKNYHKSKN